MMSSKRLVTNKNQVPEGYKQTEVGVIPVDWEVIRIRELEPYITSGSRGWAKYYSKLGALFIRITNLSRDSIYLNLNELKFVALPNNVSEGKRTRLQNEDILISITADIGIIGYITSSVPQPAYINQHISLVRFDQKNIVPKYIAYFLACENVQRLFKGATDQGAKAGLNLDRIHRLQFALPPLPEQKTIAQTLSDVDALIAALDELIAKKRHIKTGTMQQLLTGKTRLPGFGEGKGYTKSAIGVIPDWKVLRIKDIAPLQRGFDLPTSQVKKGNYPVVYSNGVMNYHSEFMVNGPGVITGRSGTIGNVHYVSENYWPHNTALWVTDFIDSHPKYIYYLYKSLKLERVGTGSGVPTLNRNDVHDLTVAIPQLEEQKAIAQVLSDIDTEIAALEKRRAKTQAIKQGMMQELLTGRTRLKIEHPDDPITKNSNG